MSKCALYICDEETHRNTMRVQYNLIIFSQLVAISIWLNSVIYIYIECVQNIKHKEVNNESLL